MCFTRRDNDYSIQQRRWLTLLECTHENFNPSLNSNLSIPSTSAPMHCTVHKNSQRCTEEYEPILCIRDACHRSNVDVVRIVEPFVPVNGWYKLAFIWKTTSVVPVPVPVPVPGGPMTAESMASTCTWANRTGFPAIHATTEENHMT
jgi:hypothetical protein